MKNFIKYMLYIYLIQFSAAILYANASEIKELNPIFIGSEIIITIIFIGLLVYNVFKKLPSNAINDFRNKCIFIFLLVSFIPLFSNIYINYRVVKINSINDLMKIEWNTHGKYILNRDLDFKDFPNDQRFVIEYFKGTLDGNGKTIYNLEVPLFLFILYNPKNVSAVKDLYLEDVNIKVETGYAASIAIFNSGKIINVHVSGKIEGNSCVGGLVTWNTSTIEYSSFNGIIIGGSHVGGIVGTNLSIVKSSFTQGEISGYSEIGGIAGYLYYDGIIEDCYTHQDISGTEVVGGISGKILEGGIIKSSFVLGNITGRAAVGVLSFYDNRAYKSLIVGNINCDSYMVEPNIFYLPTTFNERLNEQEINSKMITKEWFINVLKLDETIWDFSPLKNNEAPILKGIPKQPRTKLN